MTTSFDALKFQMNTTQGDDWEFPITVSTRLNGVKTPIDLSAATIVGVVRQSYTSGTVQTMTVTNVDLVAGQIILRLSDTQTSALAHGVNRYQVTITIAGKTDSYLEGNFLVRPKVQTV